MSSYYRQNIFLGTKECWESWRGGLGVRSICCLHRGLGFKCSSPSVYVGGSYPPRTSDLGNSTPQASTGTCTHMHTPQRCRNIIKNKSHFFLREELWGTPTPESLLPLFCTVVQPSCILSKCDLKEVCKPGDEPAVTDNRMCYLKKKIKKKHIVLNRQNQAVSMLL